MDDLPENLAKPARDWPIGDIMGIVIGALLFVLVIGMLVYVAVSHG